MRARAPDLGGLVGPLLFHRLLNSKRAVLEPVRRSLVKSTFFVAHAVDNAIRKG